MRIGADVAHARPVCSTPREVRIAWYVDPPSLIVGQMPMKNIQFVERHPFEYLLDRHFAEDFDLNMSVQTIARKQSEERDYKASRNYHYALTVIGEGNLASLDATEIR